MTFEGVNHPQIFNQAVQTLLFGNVVTKIFIGGQYMFKKILKVILDELEIESFKFGDLIFSKPGIISKTGERVYRLEFYTPRNHIATHNDHVVVDFPESYDIFVDDYKVSERYLLNFSIVDKEGITRFYKEILSSSYIQLELEDLTIRELMRNQIEFCITTKASGRTLLRVNRNTENFKLHKIQNYVSIDCSGNCGSTFEVQVPSEDSEIRIYFQE